MEPKFITVTRAANGGNIITHHQDDGTEEHHVTKTNEGLKAHLKVHYLNSWGSGSFKTPTGKTLTPGHTVKHINGMTGRVVGQHPDTKRAEILWSKPKQKEKT
jgi:hypothetical protein